MPEPLYSSLADDPAMADLIPMFVDVLPQRMAAFRADLEAGDRDALRVKAHQLKGAAGGYGFAPIGQAAASLERALADGQDPAPALEELAALCQRAR
jgi:HPt (histidine-containing phosphotransfer) domain-containing protein